MSALTVELPDKLHEKAREVAAAKKLIHGCARGHRLGAEPLASGRGSVSGRPCGTGDRKRSRTIPGQGSRCRAARMGSVARRLQAKTISVLKTFLAPLCCHSRISRL